MRANAGECGKPDFSVKVTPNSNTVNIVVGKKARFLVGSEMGSFFANKIKEAGGDPQQVQPYKCRFFQKEQARHKVAIK